MRHGRFYIKVAPCVCIVWCDTPGGPSAFIARETRTLALERVRGSPPCYPLPSLASGSRQKETFMRFFARIIALPAVVLLALAGCDQPTAPAALQGEITARTLQPDNGATLTAEECLFFYCSDNIQLAFDVQLNQEMPGLLLTATFYADSQRCAVTGSEGGRFVRANTTATFTMELMFFDLENIFLCPLPQRTTKMVVELWQAQPNQTVKIVTREGAQLLLTREFAHGYTFVRE